MWYGVCVDSLMRNIHRIRSIRFDSIGNRTWEGARRRGQGHVVEDSRLLLLLLLPPLCSGGGHGWWLVLPGWRCRRRLVLARL